MNRVIYLMILLLGAGSVQAQVYNVNANIKNNARSIEQHLKEDKRLIDANKEIGFIQAFENEVVDEKKVVFYPDISTDLLTLTPQFIFKVTKTQATEKIVDSQGQEVGEFHHFKFVNVFDDKELLILSVSTYAQPVGYNYARDSFLLSVRGTSMPFIPFKKGAADLGTVSFKSQEIYPSGKIVWVYRNIYFKASSANLPEEAVLKIASWAQQQVKHPNQ